MSRKLIRLCNDTQILKPISIGQEDADVMFGNVVAAEIVITYTKTLAEPWMVTRACHLAAATLAQCMREAHNEHGGEDS